MIEDYSLVEIEPFRFVGFEIDIGPLSRMFTHSGWKI